MIVFSRDYYFSYLIIILYLILLPGCVLFRQCPFPLSDDRDRIIFQQLAWLHLVSFYLSDRSCVVLLERDNRLEAKFNNSSVTYLKFTK